MAFPSSSTSLNRKILWCSIELLNDIYFVEMFNFCPLDLKVYLRLALVACSEVVPKLAYIRPEKATRFDAREIRVLHNLFPFSMKVFQLD